MALSVATATPILAYLGIAVIFNSTVLLFNAIMQAHGDVTTPVVNMLIGGVVKVVVNYILVAIRPQYHRRGHRHHRLLCDHHRARPHLPCAGHVTRARQFSAM